MSAPELAVGAIVRRDQALLLIRRARPPSAGRWSVPGGRVDRGESLAAAVERELHEETGLVGSCGPLVGIAERVDDLHHYVILDFEVTIDDGQTVRASSDAADARFVDYAEVASIDLVDGLFEFLDEHGVLR